MDSIYEISLDLHKPSAPISLSAKHGDTGREIHINLTDGSTPYKIPDGSYAVFAGTKPDNKVLWNACTINGDTIIYELTAQTVAVVGCIPVQIRLYGAGGKLLTSPDFVLIVDSPVVEDSSIVTVSDNEVTALTKLVTECTALKADLDKFKMGGYYTPSVVNVKGNTVAFEFTPSSDELPTVEPKEITIPVVSGVHVLAKGETVDDAPEDAAIIIDPNAETDEPATKAWVTEQINQVKNDMPKIDGLASETWVASQIEAAVNAAWEASY